jgi:hypothetical protein
VTSTTFAAASRPFIEGARLPARDLLPVIPPGASLWGDSGVDPSQCGKIPGRYLPQSGQWCGLGGTWPLEGLEPGLMSRAGSWPTGNVGLRAAQWPAVDVDVSTPEVRDWIEGLILFQLGFSPFRERGGSPRSLAVFRLTGDEPARKMRVVFDLDGNRHAVEVLAMGQQYLIAGVHPSGALYRWRENYDLATWGIDGLSPVTAKDLRDFVRLVADSVLERGGKLVSQSQQRLSAAGEGVAVADLEPVIDTDLALSALRAVPNDQQHMPDRSDFVAVLAAFKAATGKHAEDYRDEAREWATEHGWAEPDYFEHVWRSLTHVRVSADLLLRNARKFGWHEDMKRDFGPVTEEDEAVMAAARAEQDDVKEALATAANHVVYWPEQQMWLAVPTGEMLSHSAINNHAIGMTISPAGSTGLKAASARLRNSGLVRDVVGVTYSPGKPPIMEWQWEGRSGIWYNRWRAGPPAASGRVSDDDIRPFLDHVHWLFNGEEAATLLQFLAHLVQRPGVKIRWAPVIIGAQGLGKDAFLKPVVWALGSHNVAEISPHHLLERWTFYYESQLVVVQEMLRLDKVEVYERVKASITGTGAGTLLVEKKYQPAYPIPNTTSFLFLTNHSDAFAIAHDDRRFYVVQCVPSAPHEAEYYEVLHRWYADGGAAKVAAWLRQIDLSSFPADAAPAWTAAKQAMLEDTLPPFAGWIAEQVQSGKGLFGKRTVLATNEIRDLITTNFSIPGKVREGYSHKQVALGLRSLGWTRPPHQIVMPGGERTRVWCSTAALAREDAQTLRERLLAEQRAASEFTAEE